MPEDLDALLVQAEQEAFGRCWQIAQQSAGPWRDITGTFDRYHLSLPMQEGPPQSERQVCLSVNLAAIPYQVRPGFQVRGMRKVYGLLEPAGDYWQVTEVKPDAMGGALLVLGAARGRQGA